MLLLLLCLCLQSFHVYADDQLTVLESGPESGCVQCHTDGNPLNSEKIAREQLMKKCVLCHTGVMLEEVMPEQIAVGKGPLVSSTLVSPLVESFQESDAYISSTIGSVVGSVVAAEKDFVSSTPLSGKQAGNRPAGTAGNLKPGMRYPMYNLTTRLGDKPNEMILIPSGEFTMGSNSRLPDEGPMHKVTVAAYYIDRYEVTNMQYKSFIDATQRR